MSQSVFVIPAESRASSIERLSRFVGACLPGKRLLVTVAPYRKRRSDQQNRYLWGGVYAEMLRHLPGWTAPEVHELMLGNWGGWEVVEAFGQKRKRPIRRSSKLSTVEFNDFVAHIQQFCAEQGIYISDPNEERE